MEDRVKLKEKIKCKRERFKDNFDWRLAKIDVLGEVENQLNCDACWAFVAARLVQSQYNIYLAQSELPLIKFAVQQLVDCCKVEKLECYTNSINKGLVWIKENGICTEDDYGGYKAIKEDCKKIKPTYEGLIESITKIIPDHASLDTASRFLNVETEVKTILRKHPVGAAIYVYQSFKNWESSEIYYPPDGEQIMTMEKDGKVARLRHAIMVVGDGICEKTGVRFWIIKNTWGESWGDKGFAKIRRSSSVSGGYNENTPLIHDFIYPLLKVRNEKKKKMEEEIEKN